ncbi:MAG: anti-sigma factor [Actinomycetota bacterium]|nr:anti-sigma factor [Actinomycetota bacterium]
MVSHSDDEALALLALGESVSRADEAHVAGCPRCQSRLDQLSAVVSSARAIEPADYPTAPPPAVWRGITTELGMAGGVVAPLPTGARSGRRRMWAVASVAAAIGLIVGGAGVATVLDRQPEATVVATAELGAMSEAGLTGTAVLHRGDAGNLLTVSIPGLPGDVDGYYEVWMATADAGTMIALGTLAPGAEATFTLPGGLDPAAFPVVDVSHEHFDGDPEHSAESLVRGQLQA